jgi:hypothetical protein
VIWPSLLADGCVDDRAWREALDAGGFVGSCQAERCGGSLKPARPFPQGRYRTGYMATCSVCGTDYGAVGPSDAPAKTTKRDETGRR